MTVFKHYFNIVKEHMNIIIIFASISIVVSILNTSYSSTEGFDVVESKVAIINRDDSKLANNIEKYIKDKNIEIDVEDDKRSIQDAIYDNRADTILIIPENFSKDFYEGKDVKIEIKKSSEISSQSVELVTNKYIKMIKAYTEAGMTEDEAISVTNEILDNEIETEISSKNDMTSNSKLFLYYTLSSYAFLSIFIFIVGTIMCIFNSENIKKRNIISSYNPSSMSKQLLLGHVTITASIWLIFVLISIILYKSAVFTISGGLFILSSFILTITITCLAFLIGNMFKNQNAISGVQNVLAVGLCFISGVFVDSSMLDSSVLNVSKLFPIYWYVEVNKEISNLQELTLEGLKPIYSYFGIILAFGLLYFIISRILVKRNKI